MVNSKVKSIINLHALFLFYSFVIIVSKIASKYPFLSEKFFLYYGIELLMTAAYAYFWQIVIKRISLGTAYSNKAVILFWTLIWSFLFFREKVKLNHIAGMIAISIGIVLVTKND